MGIVIINGKRYDSITGLMIDDNKSADFADMNAYQGSSPDWLNNFVDNPEPTNDNANNTNAINEETSSEPEQVKEQPEEQVIPVRTTNVDHAQKVNIEDSRESSTTADTPDSSDAKPIRSTQHMRHKAMASYTLNRRFVRKPLNANGEYAESIAIQHIKEGKTAAKLAKPIEIPVEEQLNAATEATNDFVPIANHSNLQDSKEIFQTTTSHLFETHSYKPATESTDTTSQKTHQQLLDDRIDQLVKILEDVQEVDAIQYSKSKRSDRQAAKLQKIEQRKQAKLDKKEQRRQDHRERRFRAPAILSTVGAMAVVVAVGVYMIMPTVSIKMAASKAGIDAKTPYVPSGFNLDSDIAFNPGKITINYKSANNENGYSITQESRPSLTDNELKDELAAKSDGKYQVSHVDDATVYTYRDMITWARDGMQYTVNTNGYLSSDQIDQIVKSL